MPQNFLSRRSMRTPASLDYQQYIEFTLGLEGQAFTIAKSFGLDGSCTYEAYGTDLIAAIDCIWEKINGENSETVDLSRSNSKPAARSPEFPPAGCFMRYGTLKAV